MASLLDEVMAKLSGMSPAEVAELERDIEQQAAAVWIPSHGPQYTAYFHPADELLYGGSGGSGKALDIDTDIPTPSGWTTMGDLAVGDEVFDENGKICRVTACSPVMIGRPCYRLTFSDGAEIVADAEHRWLTMTQDERDSSLTRTEEWRARRRAKRPSRAKPDSARPWLKDVLTRINQTRQHEYKAPPSGAVRTTKEISETLGYGDKRGGLNHSVAIAEPLDLPDADLPIDPYVLGAWLGDGSSYKAEMTIAEPEMFDLFEAACEKHGWVMSRRANLAVGVNGGMKVALRETGVLENKHIPPVYLRGSREQRIALLQGLGDTDGCVDARGNCEFTSTRLALAEGVLELVLSLGCKANMLVGTAKLNGRTIGPKYRINFVARFPAFRLQRKLDRQALCKHRPTTRRRYISSADEVTTRPVKCISVDSASKLFLCGREMIPTHNSDLALGLAFTAHWNSLILRRQYVDLGGMIERAIEINGTRDGFSGAVPPRLYTKDGRRIVFGAHKEAGDEQSFQGAPYSLKIFDEAVQHLLSQIKFHLGWLRSTRIDENGKPERCRAVLATNPPIDSSGDWIIERYRPWLDLTHHNPAKHGEMRWFITNPDGEDQEVDGPEPMEFTVNGEKRTYKPLSRTFIPGKLSDNPYLVNTNYQSQLDALPEPIRSAVRDGNFMLSRADTMNQVIPSDWVMAAQNRWTKDGHRGKKMSAIGYDPAGGGRDSAELVMRYDFYYSDIVTVKGEDTKDGSMSVALLFKHRRDNAIIVIDHGGGYAGQTALRLRDNETDYVAYNGNHQGIGRDASGKLKFYNHRAEVWWKFREALDPDQPGGSQIALPPSAELRADLTTPTYTVEKNGIQIESKDSIRKKLGRSPGKGDAVVLAWAPASAAIRKRDSVSATGPRNLPTHSQSTRAKSPLARRRGR